MRSALLLLSLVPCLVVAQERSARVVVTDSLGNRVAFAWVQVRSGIARAADDSGRVSLDVPASDSIQLTARRIGYTPFEGRVGRDAALDAYRVVMNPLPQALERINIIAPRENRLYRNGFYERLEQSFKVATPSRFLSPEAIEARPASRTSQLLDGISFVSVRREQGKPIVLGRGSCGANIVLDGKRPSGMIEELATREGETEVGRIAVTLPPNVAPEMRRMEARRIFVEGRQTIDDLVSPGTIAAIEVYGSANQAPPELRIHAREPMCALVVIWTGPRQ